MKLKQGVALLLAGMMVLGLTGCLGKFYNVAMTVDGQEISAGTYLAIQYNVYTEAKSKVEDSKKSVFKQKIEGESAVSWIRGRTHENVLKYVCIGNLCREKEIVLNEENKSYLEQMKSYSSSMEDLYIANGFSVDTMMKVMANGLLGEQLFTELYGPDGELAPPDSELMASYAEENANVKYIMVPISAGEGEPDKTEEVTAIAEGMQKDLEAGKSTESVAEAGLKEVYALLGREFTDTTVSSSISTSYINYAPADNETYSEEFLKTLKEQTAGSFGVYNMGNLILVYEKLEPVTDAEEFSAIRPTVIRSLCYDDYEAYLAGIYEKYTLEEVTGATGYLSPKKIVTSDELAKRTTVS